jgi:hypothetical protein
MKRQLRRRASATHGQVGQDKFHELLEAQLGWNALPVLMFRHLRPQKNGTIDHFR